MLASLAELVCSYCLFCLWYLEALYPVLPYWLPRSPHARLGFQLSVKEHAFLIY